MGQEPYIKPKQPKLDVLLGSPGHRSPQLSHWFRSSFLQLLGAVDHVGSRDRLHPFSEHAERVALAVSVANSVRLPASNLVDNVGRAFNGPEPIPHRMAEAVHRATYGDVVFQPLVQSGTCGVRVCHICFVVSWESQWGCTRLIKDTLWAHEDEATEPDTISAPDVAAAIGFTENYIIPMAERSFATFGGTKEIFNAISLLELIRSQGWTEFTQRQLQRSLGKRISCD